MFSSSGANSFFHMTRDLPFHRGDTAIGLLPFVNPVFERWVYHDSPTGGLHSKLSACWWFREPRQMLGHYLFFNKSWLVWRFETILLLLKIFPNKLRLWLDTSLNLFKLTYQHFSWHCRSDNLVKIHFMIVVVYTMECNLVEPLFNEVLDITSDILCPGQSYSKMCGIEPRYNEPRYNEFFDITKKIRKPKRKIHLDITNYNVSLFT